MKIWENKSEGGAVCHVLGTGGTASRICKDREIIVDDIGRVRDSRDPIKL